MKKTIVLVLAFLLTKLGIVSASDVIVRSNPESGEYSFPIEVYLMSNYKDAKIFYYTDGEGRMDRIKEYKNPILLKEDTTIDFYAITKDYKESLVQTSVYTFKYPQEIDILEKNGKIALKNNSLEIQNIGFRKIKGNNLDYEINPNTFVEAGEIYEINYTPKHNEKLTLYSPDKKVVKNFTFKSREKEKSKPNDDSTLSAKSGETNQTLTKSGEIKQINADEDINSQITQTKATEGLIKKESFSLNESIKASLIDSRSQNSNLTKNDAKVDNSHSIYIVFLAIISILLYNTWLLLKRTQKFAKIKEIINRIGKK